MLLNEKKPKAAPTRTIECNFGDTGGDTTTTSIGEPGSGISSQKRKAAQSSYEFPASKTCISLYAPIETHQKKNKITTGVPSGKTNKDVTYNLAPFILIGRDNNSSQSLDEEA